MFGPGQLTGWSPSVSASSRDEDDFWLGREVDQIVGALEDKGEQRRRDLATLVGSKYWGPGRFRHALSAALEQGKIRRPAPGPVRRRGGRG